MLLHNSFWRNSTRKHDSCDRTAQLSRGSTVANAARSSDRKGKPKQLHRPHRHPSEAPKKVTGDAGELNCDHFKSCSGCSISHELQDPPVVHEAKAFFASRGFDDFQTVGGPIHGWRCRAKLAVRGTAADPQIGLFQLGSHNLVAIPECRAHHPRINQAAQLIKQVTAALRIQPYAEPQQQQQHQGGKNSPSGSSSSRSGGYLRYIQLTALPSKPGGRAELDPDAQIQVVLVWCAPDAGHPSVTEAKRLAAALWSQAGHKQTSQLAALRQRAEAAAAAAGSSSNSSSSRVGRSSPRQQRQQQQQQQQQRPGGSVAAVQSRLSAVQGGLPAPLIHSVWLNFHPADDSNAVLGREWLLCAGQQWGWQDFGGVPVAMGPGGFVQANYGAMQQCLSAIAAATPHDSSVVEYYAGCGVIGLSLAAAGAAREVVCVEVNPESKKAFDVTKQQLARVNQAAADAVSHHVASADDPKQLQQLLVASDASVLVVDPPRKGLDKSLLQLLTAQQTTSNSSSNGIAADSNHTSGGSAEAHIRSAGVPHIKRVIYLSCGFKALMSDTDALLAAGWNLSSCQAYFFFPGTDSIETLAVFDR